MGIIRLLHVADTHLGASPYGLAERESDFYDAFREVVDIAIERRVNAVIHGGDLFHVSRPKPLTLMKAVDGLQRLRNAGIDFIVAPGNHELPKGERVGSPVRLLEKLGLAKASHDVNRPEVYSVGDVSIIVFSEWSSELLARLDPAGLAKSPIRVALAHASLCDAFSLAEGIPESQCTSRLYSNLIRRGYTYVALGDLHTGWMGRLEDGTPIVYPGSTEYLGIDEYRRDPERSVYIVDIGGPGDVKLERVRLKSTRPWVIVEGNNVNSIIGSVHAGLERVRGKEPIVMVKVKGEISRIDRGKLVNELDKLKRNNKILYYNVDVEGGKLLFRPSRRHQPEVSLDDILKDIIKCDKAISLLKTFIEEPELAGKLVEELGRDGTLLKCLEDSESSTRGVKLL